MDLGRRIMNLRRARGLEQQELARAVGVFCGSLSKIENGINRPRGRILFRIARALGVPADYLLDQSQPYPYEPNHWRAKLPRSAKERKRPVRMKVTLEEREFL